MILSRGGMYRRGNQRWSTATILLLIGLFVGGIGGCQQNSDNKTSSQGKNDELVLKDDPFEPGFTIPKGKPAEILKFVKKLSENHSDSNDPKQVYEHELNIRKTTIRACDLILANKSADNATLSEATKEKLIATIGLVIGNAGVTPEQAMSEVNLLCADPRPVVAEAANQFLVPAKTLNYAALSETEQKQLAHEVIESVAKSKAAPQPISNAGFLAHHMLEAGQTDAAIKIFSDLANTILKSSQDQNTRNLVPQFQNRAQQLRMLGTKMELVGSLVGGGVLNWEAYRGKVVLVDFWATWCGPCVEELPNIRSNYEKYHDRGFEVLGISLDHSIEPLERFIRSESIPWPQVFESGAAKTKGFFQPMAVRFSIKAIPAAFLVDQEGKIVSANARGDELTRQLEKLLGQ